MEKGGEGGVGGEGGEKQARKPRSYASPKLRPTHSLTHLLTGVKCRATSVAKNMNYRNN